MTKQFIAPQPDINSPHHKQFIKYFESLEIGKPILENLELIEHIEDLKAELLISHLLELACTTQNIANINIGRYYLQNMPREWVKAKISGLIKPILIQGDYWEYIRCLELFSTIDEELTREITKKAIKHEDIEIRELGLEYI